jgi:hypothetical protein
LAALRESFNREAIKGSSSTINNRRPAPGIQEMYSSISRVNP